MKKIFKYELGIKEKQEIKLPVNAEIIRVDDVDGKFFLWAIVEPPKEDEEIETYPENSFLRLNQYNIHRVSGVKSTCLRSFLKVSFSQDKYDLRGNSINRLLNYNWDMKERKKERNIPQSRINS